MLSLLVITMLPLKAVFKRISVFKICCVFLSVASKPKANVSWIKTCTGGGAHAGFVHRGRQNQQILKFLVAALRFLEITLKFGNRENKRRRVIDTL